MGAIARGSWVAIIHRGDIVICALSGDYGKPRPAVVVQSNLFSPTHASITVCPVTSHTVDAPLFRLPLPANSKTGLKKASQIMADKMVAIRSDRISKKIGALNAKQQTSLDKALKLWLEL